MGRQNQIVGYLKAEGLKVEVVNGAYQRGSSSFDPEGVVDHWTAGPNQKNSKNARPSLNVVVNGHSTLPGPLCNVYLDRRGVAVVVATGRANHAGRGEFAGYAGNSRFFGIEAEAANNEDFTAAQRIAYPKVNAALLKSIKRTNTKTLCGHSEYALPRGRKIDINGYTMDNMRKQVKAILDGVDVKPTTSKPAPKPVAKKDAYAKRKYTTAEKQRIMKFLAKEGFYKGAIDDDYGWYLYTAVKAFQSAQTYFPNMLRDGDWGPLMDKHIAWVKELEKNLRLWRAVTIPLDPDGNYLVDTKRAVRQVQAGNFKPTAKLVKDRGAYYKAGGRKVDADPGRITCKMLGIKPHPAL